MKGLRDAQHAFLEADAVLHDKLEATVRNGPDVASFQGDVDWQKTSEGSDFGFLKATEGLDYKNPTFTKAHLEEMDKAAIVRGFYHFARPQPGRDPRKEARFFVQTVKAAGGWQLGSRGRIYRIGDLPGVLDIEVSKDLSPGQLQTWIGGWVAEYKSLTGAAPIIYTYPAFWIDEVGNPTSNYGCPLWLAAYGSNDGRRHEGARDRALGLIKAWDRATFWQFTSEGVCLGVKGRCDMNDFDGTRRELLQLTTK